MSMRQQHKQTNKKTKKKLISLFFILVLCTNCGAYISNIPEVKAVNETHTGKNGFIWGLGLEETSRF